MRQDPAVAGSGKTIKEPDSGAVRSVFDIHSDNELFARVAADERTAGIARYILGGDLYVHQSRMNFKPGFTGKEFYWHSDFETWHVEDGMPRMRCLSCSILLTDNEPHNGPLMLMPGSHKHYVRCVGATPENHYEKSLRKQEFGVPDQNSLSELASRFGIDCATGPAGSSRSPTSPRSPMSRRSWRARPAVRSVRSCRARGSKTTARLPGTSSTCATDPSSCGCPRSRPDRRSRAHERPAPHRLRCTLVGWPL